MSDLIKIRESYNGNLNFAQIRQSFKLKDRINKFILLASTLLYKFNKFIFHYYLWHYISYLSDYLSGVIYKLSLGVDLKELTPFFFFFNNNIYNTQIDFAIE